MGSTILYHTNGLPGIHKLHIHTHTYTFRIDIHPNTIITKLDFKNSLIYLEGCETFLSAEDGINFEAEMVMYSRIVNKLNLA